MQALGNIVRGLELPDTGHMAGRANGATEITDFPGPGGGVPVPFVVVSGVEYMAVFGGLKNLYIWVIRAQVALGAGEGLARFGYRKPVTRVAGSAVTGAAIRIDVPHTRVRPGFGSGPAILIKLDLCPMTLHATGFHGRTSQLGMLPAFVNAGQGVQVILG